MSTPFNHRQTPGVYVNEVNAFPPSIAGVATAVPAFIGYTQTAVVDGKSVVHQPVPVASLADYEKYFGTGFSPVYDIVPVPAPPGSQPANWDLEVNDGYYDLELQRNQQFHLYNSIRLFFNNGGGNCYVVSVGDYSTPVSGDALLSGLEAIRRQTGPTMLAAPDAALLPDLESYAGVVNAMIEQSAGLGNRLAIIDVYGAETLKSPLDTKDLDTVVNNFYQAVRSDDASLSYGAAYFPFLNSSLNNIGDVNYLYFGAAMLQQLLGEVADTLYPPGTPGPERAQVQEYIDNITVFTDPKDPRVASNNTNLVNALPPYLQWEEALLSKIAPVPPSGAMAGIFTLNDSSRGVWNAPANMPVNSVTSVTVNLNDAQQGPLNVPLNGKAIDVIRDFTGRGTIVWGARTLDGNSNDWRYIQVRRTIIYIEQSIKNSLALFTFAANDGQTWAAVTSMISNFLLQLWQQGGLMGDKASDAFTVQCGLPGTMTPDDILNGYMIVQVTVQMIHPPEFIELAFKQAMQGA